MNIIDGILKELAHESAATRRMLERTPMEKREWRPHPKSMMLGRLVSHIAEIPTLVLPILEQDEMVWDPANYKPVCYENTASLLSGFETALETAQRVMTGKSDEHLMRLWRFRAGEQTLFELPRIAVLRSMVLNHLVHHRGQLSVYLRMHDVPLPSVYGPTADEETPPPA